MGEILLCIKIPVHKFKVKPMFNSRQRQLLSQLGRVGPLGTLLKIQLLICRHISAQRLSCYSTNNSSSSNNSSKFLIINQLRA
jgi:hypothetical protein